MVTALLGAVSLSTETIFGFLGAATIQAKWDTLSEHRERTANCTTSSSIG